jgi:MoaA/NifB/PqqE/SkfB family radical SAM enzyme
MTLESIRKILEEAATVPSIRSIYFEGGEPFLYYPIMAKGVRMAAEAGYDVGVVTNGYWATGVADAEEWLRPLAGLVSDLTVSSDLYHEDERTGIKAPIAKEVAGKLGVPFGVIRVARPGETAGGFSPVMHKGRAAANLAEEAPRRSSSTFTDCPYEDLEEPGRVHVDPFGNLHICQGIVIGNIFTSPLAETCENYDVESHPVTGPLHRGGPAELARTCGLPVKESYADPCQMCFEARLMLRERFAEILTPDQMYGDPP